MSEREQLAEAVRLLRPMAVVVMYYDARQSDNLPAACGLIKVTLGDCRAAAEFCKQFDAKEGAK